MMLMVSCTLLDITCIQNVEQIVSFDNLTFIMKGNKLLKSCVVPHMATWLVTLKEFDSLGKNKLPIDANDAGNELFN